MVYLKTYKIIFLNLSDFNLYITWCARKRWLFNNILIPIHRISGSTYTCNIAKNSKNIRIILYGSAKSQTASK